MALLPPDPVFCLKSPEMGSVTSLCFQNTERLMAGTQKGTVHLWDLQTNRSSFQLKVGQNSILSIAHSETAFITQEKDGTLKIWTLTNKGYVLSAEAQNEHVGFCKFVYDSTTNSVISPRNDANICIYNETDLTERQVLVPPENLPHPLGHVMCFCPIQILDRHFILAGYESGVVLVWDLKCNKHTGILKIGTEECLMAIDYDPVTNRGVCGGSSDKIHVFSLNRNSFEIVYKMEIGIKNAGIHCLKIRKDLKVFASGGWDGRIRIFSWKSLRPLAVLTEHKGELLDIAYSNEKVSLWKSPIMAAAGVDGQISLWDIYN